MFQLAYGSLKTHHPKQRIDYRIYFEASKSAPFSIVQQHLTPIKTQLKKPKKTF
jgi:hypothetical protein